jgi:thioredoxin reductase (NADPH)
MTTNAAQGPVVIVGAGPIGIEVAASLKQAGVDYVHFEAGQVGQTITWFPRMMRFFSSPDRIAIAGIPIPRIDESKCSREEYLAYLRMVVDAFDLDIRTYQRVERVEPLGEGRGFRLLTRRHILGAVAVENDLHEMTASKLILASGDLHSAHKIGVPGEELPHVTHYFQEPHTYYRQNLLVVGGHNSAVEAALRCHRCGARVTMCIRKDKMDEEAIKFWILPEIKAFIDKGEITCHYGMEPAEIRPGQTILQPADGKGDLIEVDADFVLLMTGYEADLTLFDQAGVSFDTPVHYPVYDEQTMETNVPGLYVAGTAAVGDQNLYRLFIENCHIHARRIAAHIAGRDIPDDPSPQILPES